MTGYVLIVLCMAAIAAISVTGVTYLAIRMGLLPGAEWPWRLGRTKHDMGILHFHWHWLSFFEAAKVHSMYMPNYRII
jgi:hypothetical protein